MARWLLSLLLTTFALLAAAAPAAAQPIRCADYLDFLRPHAAGYEQGLDRQQYGPRHALPALAFYRRSGDPRLAEGIKQTLRHYGRWVDAQIAASGGVQTLEGIGLLGIHFRELRAHGHVTAADERWLRNLILRIRRHHYGLRPGDGPWRGSQHRGATDATNNLLAAAFYPDQPDARRWRAAGETAWNDWWRYRDIGINDIAYFSDSLAIYLRAADLLGRSEMFTDPQARAILWERMVHETSPDGALIPYGAHAGWHGLAGIRIWALEAAARATRDGRYRWVAGRLMRYALARGGFSPGHDHWSGQSIEAIALAALSCDDNVAPVAPDAGSRVLMRPEILRLTRDQMGSRFPGEMLDAHMDMGPRLMPSKLVLRSGWRPGDLFMLVEAFPRHDPLNPTAILALEHGGATFAEMISEKDVSRENAVRIEDLSGEAQFVGAGRRTADLPTGYDRMESSVEAFGDDALATHARLRVSNYQGYRAEQRREFLFVKNRFVLVRDETAFADRFRARVGPVWNTQHVARQRGEHWIDTWFSGHWLDGQLRLYGNAPGRLLIHYAARPDARLTVSRPPAAPQPSADQRDALRHFVRTQFAWEGLAQPGLRLQFVTLLLPHDAGTDPARLARSIQVLRDEPGLAAVALAGTNGWELTLLNPDGQRLELASPRGPIVTDARALYLRLGDDPPLFTARGATTVQVGSTVLLRSQAPADAARTR
jgi:hypothetical protein